MPKSTWTPERIERLRELAPTTTIRDLAKIFGLSYEGMKSAFERYKIKRTPEQIRAINRKMNAVRTGANNPGWKGGRSKIHYYYKKRQQERFPERIWARQKVCYAIKYGHLTRQPCEICGAENSQAHHDDYSKPLDVRWFCGEHHNLLHRIRGIERIDSKKKPVVENVVYEKSIA